MATDNPSSISAQRSRYNSMQSTQVSVTDACHYLNCSLSYISIQALGSIDQELQPNGHLLGIDSASHYPDMNYMNAPPPTRYYDDPPHLATVGVRVLSFMSSFLTEALPKGPGEQPWNQSQHQLDGHRPPATIHYTPVIHVRVLDLLSPLLAPLSFFACTYKLFY